MVSVIIPTMNRPRSLDQTLSYIVKSEYIPSELIIVDQSTTDYTTKEYEKVIEKYRRKFDKIIFKHQDEPSLTKARNNGYADVTNEMVVFMDDDVDVRTNTFRSILEFLSDSSISMIGGINEGEEVVPTSVMSYLLGMASYNKREYAHVAWSCYGRFAIKSEERTPTEWAMGFFFVVRKSLMDKWNIRFDEKLKSYAYAEDLDFSYRYYKQSKENGYKCIMSTVLTVKHNISKEYRIPKRSATFMAILYRLYLTHKLNISDCNIITNVWCNLGIYISKLIRREKPKDVLDAHLFYFKHRKDIKNGIFHEDKW